MSDVVLQSILSAIRSILIALGSLVTLKGWADDATIQAVIGAIMVILPAIWGVVNKVLSERRTKVREKVAVQETVQQFTEGARQ